MGSVCVLVAEGCNKPVEAAAAAVAAPGKSEAEIALEYDRLTLECKMVLEEKWREQELVQKG